MVDILTTKWCNKCKAHLPVADFFNNRNDVTGLSTYCANHEREHVKQWNRKRRQKFLQDMGGKCVRCGFDDWRALQVDHIDSDGAEERAEKGFRHDSNKWYAHVLAHPERYQLLCANCNTIKKYESDEMPGPKMLRDKPTHRFNKPRPLKKFETVGGGY